MKINKRYNIITMVMVLCLLLGNSISSFAAGNHELLQVNTKDSQIIAYVKGDSAIEKVDCQIGMTPSENIQFSKFADGNVALHTVILFDNSLSVTQANKEKAVAILQSYFESKNINEWITLATFGEDLQIVVEKTNDSQTLIDGLNSIQHNDQDTYLTDVLYEYLDTLSVDELTRFIVMSDGVDNKAIGITKDELLEKLDKNMHPIYTLGHIYKNNESELENMFALSRATGGSVFLIDDIIDNSVVVNELIAVDSLLCLKAEIPTDIQDGSTKNVLFTVTSASGISEIKAEVEMPFSIKEEPVSVEEITVEETTVEETIPEPVVETTEEETTIVVETVDEEEDDDSLTTIAAIVLIAVAVLLLLKNKKAKGDNTQIQPKESKKKNKKGNIPVVPVPMPVNEPDMDSTVLFTGDMDATVMLDRRYMLLLRDVHDSDKIFKYPLDGSIILGRNVDMVNVAIDYNRTVSGKHCEIYVRNGRFYVRDLNSANKTYVNGRVIQMDTEIQSGCMIALGEVELSVEIIPI